MSIQETVETQGFAIINSVFSNEQIDAMLLIISGANHSTPSFRKTKDLFAIRQFFKEVPAVVDPIFSERFCNLITEAGSDDYFIVKSIYFDKPETSNWFVSYHQDLTISVNRKMDIDGFGSWTKKQNQYAVQPPLSILQDNFTIRIHLDTTNEENGALKVIPGSHLKNIYRAETINRNDENEVGCNVEKGGIMIMKPLLLHSSGRTTSGNKRRVIHIEFSRSQLPDGLCWSEFMEVVKDEYSDEFKQEFDEMYEEYLRGDMKTYSLEEVKEIINRDLGNSKR